MAEAVVSFAVERLGSLLISEAKFLQGVKEQIEEIQTELKRMQCFLKDADSRQVESNSVRNWVAEIRELALTMEDVIEMYAMEVASKKETKSSCFKKILRRFACIVREGVTLHKIGSEIESLRGKLTSLTTSLQTYGIKALEEGESSNAAKMRRQHQSRISYSHLIEKDFVGMEKDFEKLVSYLKDKENGCEVISIWGMGGQGKTTLARKIYNHTEVRTYFQAFAWVCITQQLERKEVLQSILKQLLPEREEEISRMEDRKLVGELHKIQQEKVCLVVVDDIWKLDDWKSLTAAFPIGLETTGSKILITTRMGKVAQVGLSHKLEGLSEEEGWQLLLKKAFPTRHGDAEQSDKSDMEKIGRDIVRRCRGLPLAISTMGGVLKGKALKDWEMINKDIALYLRRGDGISEDDEYGTVSQVLALSYNNLPPRLKHCLLYLGHFEEDEELEVEDLYISWLAEGFVSQEDQLEGEIMLDVAERYLDDLAQRSLVQVELIKPEDVGRTWSKFRACGVHDLIRDLCISKGKEEDFLDVIDFEREKDLQLLNSKYTAGSLRARRLGILSYETHKNDSLVSFAKQHVIPHVRSLKFRGYGGFDNEWPEKLLSVQEFRLVRVLTFKRFDFTNEKLVAARKIGELVYLMYLSFRDCKLEEMPSSIGNLRYLETLDLRVESTCIVRNVLWKLKKLKHLYLPSRISHDSEKLRFDGLSELELLWNFNPETCSVGGLMELSRLQIFSGNMRNDLQDLTGTINSITHHHLRYSSVDISYYDVDSNGGEEFSFWRLVFECPNLNMLSIWVTVGALPIKEFVHHMSFSQSLSFINLGACELEEDPMIFLEKLPNLRNLSFGPDSFMGEEMRCSNTGFPQLRRLRFILLHNLTKWTVDEGALPNLSELEIMSCEKLEMLPEGLRFISSLQKLTVWCRSEAFKDKIRVKNGVEGEDFYKVGHIPSIVLK